MRDDPRHFRPGRQTIQRTRSEHVLDHGHSRALSRQGERHRHDAPPLPRPGLDLDGEIRRVRVLQDPARPRDVLSREDLVDRRGVRASAASAAAAGFASKRALPPETRRRRRSSREQRRDPLLLFQQRLRLRLQAARHGEESGDELFQFFVQGAPPGAGRSRPSPPRGSPRPGRRTGRATRRASRPATSAEKKNTSS